MNEKSMINAFMMKCEQVIEESLTAAYPSDVESAYATYCEAEGMSKLFEAGFGKPLHVADYGMFLSFNEAWLAWNNANSRVCYDPETGERIV